MLAVSARRRSGKVHLERITRRGGQLRLRKAETLPPCFPPSRALSSSDSTQSTSGWTVISEPRRVTHKYWQGLLLSEPEAAKPGDTVAITHSSLSLTWNPPLGQGGRVRVRARVAPPESLSVLLLHHSPHSGDLGKSAVNRGDLDPVRRRMAPGGPSMEPLCVLSGAYRRTPDRRVVTATQP